MIRQYHQRVYSRLMKGDLDHAENDFLIIEPIRVAKLDFRGIAGSDDYTALGTQLHGDVECSNTLAHQGVNPKLADTVVLDTWGIQNLVKGWLNWYRDAFFRYFTSAQANIKDTKGRIRSAIVVLLRFSFTISIFVRNLQVFPQRGGLPVRADFFGPGQGRRHICRYFLPQAGMAKDQKASH